MHVILDNEAKDHVVAVKQGTDGQPRPKNPRADEEYQMPVEYLLNPESERAKKGKRVSKKPGDGKGKKMSSHPRRETFTS